MRRRARLWKRGSLGAWVAAVLLAALPGLTGSPASAAEFIEPPGLNVEGQTAILKEQVTRMARDLVGDDLVDVVVHIAYLRTKERAGAAPRIKLPGFNHYITPAAGGSKEIVAGHTRIRQIVVMVSDAVDSQPQAIARELQLAGGFDTSKGDLLRVVTVAGSGSGNAPLGGAGELKRDTKALSARLQKERARQAEERETERLGKMLAQGSLNEAQSTTYLIRARAAFFNGDYNRALDQILQSISGNSNNPQAYAMLGSLYYAVDWKQLALKYWEKSLALDPNNGEIADLISQLRLNTNL
ncbi:MAG: hypothetical protein V3T00_05830 [bacterium]